MGGTVKSSDGQIFRIKYLRTKSELLTLKKLQVPRGVYKFLNLLIYSE